MDIELMTIKELEERQEKLHTDFEEKKGVCYDTYIEMLKLSEEYQKIDDELNKRKGNKTQQ